MNKKAVFITIGLMTLALIGLIVLQLNWINWSLKLSEQQFDKNVFSALNKVADRLQAKENDEALNYINGYEDWRRFRPVARIATVRRRRRAISAARRRPRKTTS